MLITWRKTYSILICVNCIYEIYVHNFYSFGCVLGRHFLVGLHGRRDVQEEFCLVHCVCLTSCVMCRSSSVSLVHCVCLTSCVSCAEGVLSHWFIACVWPVVCHVKKEFCLVVSLRVSDQVCVMCRRSSVSLVHRVCLTSCVSCAERVLSRWFIAWCFACVRPVVCHPGAHAGADVSPQGLWPQPPWLSQNHPLPEMAAHGGPCR